MLPISTRSVGGSQKTEEQETVQDELEIPLLSCGFPTHGARLSQPLYIHLQLEINAKNARR